MKNNTSASESLSIYALISYVPFLCFVTFFKYERLEQFEKKHAKQGLLLLLIEFVSLLFLIDFINTVFWKLLLILCGILSLVGIYRVASKKSWKIPVIGSIFEKYEI